MAKKKPKRQPAAKPRVPETAAYLGAMQAFHANAAALRKLFGLGQQEVADRAGISKQFVQFLEGGGQKISFTAMCFLAELYGVPIAVMLTPGAFDKIFAARNQAASRGEVAT